MIRTLEGVDPSLVKFSVVVPAFNEEAYLGATLDSLRTAAEALRSRISAEVETSVVDNNSRDRTAAIAREKGATVVHEPVQVIARARNAGARRASGDVLVFVDADVIVPPEFLIRIHAAMRRSGVHRGRRGDNLAGATPLGEALPGRLVASRPAHGDGAGGRAVRSPGRLRTGGWIRRADLDRRRRGLCLASRAARAEDRPANSADPRTARPALNCRRFDQWPLWKILIWTNPLFIAVFRRWKAAWGGWYSRAVR